MHSGNASTPNEDDQGEVQKDGAAISVAELIGAVRAAGGALRPDGADIVVEAPGPLPSALIEALRQEKPRLLDVLRKPAAATAGKPQRGREGG